MTVAAETRSLTDAIRRLVARLETLTGSMETRTGAIRRLEFELENVDPLDWLEAQTGVDKMYWRDRDGHFEIAGLGCADIISSREIPDYPLLKSQIARFQSGPETGIRYFGGFRFDPFLVPEKRDPRWNAFGSYRLVRPRFELVRENGRQYLACNLGENDRTPERLKAIIQAAGNLRGPSRSTGVDPPHRVDRQDFPNRDRWLQNVRQALISFAAGDGEKLVLARRASIDFSSGLNPWRLLGRLRDQSKNCFLFGVQPDPATTFIGASPERLYRRDHDRLQTEAIAGTRPRGHDPGTDAALARELSTSVKERWEHELVVNGLQAGLEKVCTEYDIVQTATPLKLAQVQHLVTRFSGRLKSDRNDLHIMRALHPSAAVGGFPLESAPALLHKYEPFDRGWYAGLVGWLGTDTAEFAVGIRSALLSGNRLDLFSGAGIVADSEPDAEWDEVESKIGQFLHITSGNPE